MSHAPFVFSRFSQPPSELGGLSVVLGDMALGVSGINGHRQRVKQVPGPVLGLTELLFGLYLTGEISRYATGINELGVATLERRLTHRK